jgi:hypothetical protein
MANEADRSSSINGASEPTISEKLANRALIDAALNKAAREAVLDHARAGNPVCTWRDGKVVWLQPEEIFALVAEMDRGTAPSQTTVDGR